MEAHRTIGVVPRRCVTSGPPWRHLSDGRDLVSTALWGAHLRCIFHRLCILSWVENRLRWVSCLESMPLIDLMGCDEGILHIP